MCISSNFYTLNLQQIAFPSNFYIVYIFLHFLHFFTVFYNIGAAGPAAVIYIIYILFLHLHRVHVTIYLPYTSGELSTQH
jgi:hypothetical protein